MIINGREIANQLNEQTKEQIKALSFQPLLVDVVVGEDPASLSYVRIKQKKALEVGLAFELHHLPSSSTTADVISEINKLITIKELSGLIIQLPLPKNLNTEEILSSIPEEVDVDLLNKKSSERFYGGGKTLVPPTAGAISHIIDSLPVNFSGKKILVVGQGELVGKPISYLLKSKSLDVITADSSTKNILDLLKSADCVISGVGKSGLIKGEDLKEGVIVIDAGTSEASGSIAGDVDFDSAEIKASYITPVPGGVGPVTVAKLLENVVLAAMQS